MDNPKNEDGQYICNLAHPMPRDRDTSNERWMHEDVDELTEYDDLDDMIFRCRACHKIIRVYLPG